VNIVKVLASEGFKYNSGWKARKYTYDAGIIYILSD
jgi:hypothetical protein